MKKIFVMMRYSVLSFPAHKSWKIGDKDLCVYKKNLFNESRLDLHQRLFETVAYKSLSESISNCEPEVDVELILLTSKDLPLRFKSYLYNLSNATSWMSVIEAAPEDDVVKKFEDEICKRVEGCRDILYATVRLDDDDALHPVFLANISKYLEHEFSGMAVSFSNGYAGIYDGSKYVRFHKVNAINNAQGLSLITRYTSGGGFFGNKTVYSTGIMHSRTHWVVPTIADGKDPMYIRTVHEHGDYYSEDYQLRISKQKEASFSSVCKDFWFLKDFI